MKFIITLAAAVLLALSINNVYAWGGRGGGGDGRQDDARNVGKVNNSISYSQSSSNTGQPGVPSTPP